MAEKWYDGLPQDAFVSETDKAYKDAEEKIREGIEKGLDFDAACARIDIGDEALRKNIIDDMLKVFIAEEHFGKDVPLEDLAAKLKVSVERLETAKLSMIEDVKNTSIKAFYKSLKTGNA